MSVPAEVEHSIDRTINGLFEREFDADPLVGEHLSRITSVVSSSYKRHGNIIELAMLESLKRRRGLEAWTDADFKISASADALANNLVADPEASLTTRINYEPKGDRTLQIDLIVFDNKRKHLGLYEIKRGYGLNDAGKKRQMLRDLVCMQVLGASYGEHRGYDVKTVHAHVIFYYGKQSLKEPFALSGDRLNEHFGFNVRRDVEDANSMFKRRLLSGLEAIADRRPVIKQKSEKRGFFMRFFGTSAG
jgi:hypothetical protein